LCDLGHEFLDTQSPKNGKPLALDMGRNSVAVSTAFNIYLRN
jgi:hypothetical protein